MCVLSEAELLNVWEAGRAQPPARQALLLLAAACPDRSVAELAQLSIGQRDAQLLTLREWMFGSQLSSLVSCPACGDQLELAFDTADIRADAALQSANAAEIATYTLSAAGYELRYRLPNTQDVVGIAEGEDLHAGQIALLKQCLLSAERGGAAIGAEQLPDDVITLVAEDMARIDPQADVQIALVCPACAHPWQAAFDIISFFWGEIAAWAMRILSEIHTLASAYGWSEAAILAITPWRRRQYIELIGG